MKMLSTAFFCTLLLSASLGTTGCGSGNSPVEAQTTSSNSSSKPAILTGFCGTISTPSATNWLFGLGNITNPADCSSSGNTNPFGIPMPSPGTLSNLRVVAELQGAVGDSVTGVVTVYVNRVPTALTCTATAVVAAGGPPARCSDDGHAVVVGSADEVAAAITMQSGNFAFVRAALEKQ